MPSENCWGLNAPLADYLCQISIGRSSWVFKKGTITVPFLDVTIIDDCDVNPVA